MDFELERQSLMAERGREEEHLHLVSEARGRKPRDAAQFGVQEGSPTLNARVAFFQLMTAYAAFGLVVSPGVSPSTNPS